MPIHKCKYSVGDMVDFKLGNQIERGTIQGIAFWADKEPKYMIEGFDGKKWTEDYYDIFEKDISV